jgi:hypothetical protein
MNEQCDVIHTKRLAYIGTLKIYIIPTFYQSDQNQTSHLLPHYIFCGWLAPRNIRQGVGHVRDGIVFLLTFHNKE